MSSTVTEQATRFVAAHLHRAVLKPLGYSKSGAHMFRPVADVFHGVAVSGDRWATGDRGAFSIGFHLSIPTLYSYWCGREFPRNPNTAWFPISGNVSELLSERRIPDWSVSRTTALAPLALEAEALVRESVLPFLAQLDSKTALYERILKSKRVPGLPPGNVRVVRAMLAHDLDLLDDARAQLQASHDSAETPEIAAVNLVIATRLGVRIRRSSDSG